MNGVADVILVCSECYSLTHPAYFKTFKNTQGRIPCWKCGRNDSIHPYGLLEIQKTVTEGNDPLIKERETIGFANRVEMPIGEIQEQEPTMTDKVQIEDNSEMKDELSDKFITYRQGMSEDEAFAEVAKTYNMLESDVRTVLADRFQQQVIAQVLRRGSNWRLRQVLHSLISQMKDELIGLDCQFNEDRWKDAAEFLMLAYKSNKEFMTILEKEFPALKEESK